MLKSAKLKRSRILKISLLLFLFSFFLFSLTFSVKSIDPGLFDKLDLYPEALEYIIENGGDLSLEEFLFMGNNRIIELDDPVSDLDASTKGYVISAREDLISDSFSEPTFNCIGDAEVLQWSGSGWDCVELAMDEGGCLPEPFTCDSSSEVLKWEGDGWDCIEPELAFDETDCLSSPPECGPNGALQWDGEDWSCRS